MAGNKVNTKSKGREDKNKSNKGVGQNTEDSDEPDFSLLRKPVFTSSTGFAQARKIFDSATEELKNLLINECDIIYECKICRNLFRSLINFISHKRIYCQENFNSSVHGYFNKTNSVASEILKINQVEKGYQESLKQSTGTINEDFKKDDDRVPFTKDLTAIVEKLTITKGIHKILSENPQVTLQKIPNSKVAVFQNVNFNKDESDNMMEQVKELDNILSQDKAILQKDGKFKTSSKKIGPETDNVIQISDDEENDVSDSILKCKICDLQFSTVKTLKFHMKYKHLESRLVFPCPDCLEIFSTSWSVYRHLFKVHRKSAAQIRRLREAIQAKAFRMNNPPAFYEKRKNNIKSATTQKISEEERLDQENQAWMDNMEGDGELPRCGGCGRTFERRAALAAHTHTCQPRSRALARRPQESRKIEIQIRKDYNKGPTTLNLNTKQSEVSDSKTVNEVHSDKLQKENKLNLDNGAKDVEENHSAMEVDDNNCNDSTVQKVNNKDSTLVDDYTAEIKLPLARQVEKNNLFTLKQRVKHEIEFHKLLCKRCDIRYNNAVELYEHMAGHYKWVRYACKLCNFKNYDFDKLPEHVKLVHRLKGDSDFYFSTVKAIDGLEALEISKQSISVEEVNDINESNPDSRRPSRCSSDSSRLSDDSSSSNTRLEVGSRKRKSYQSKINLKRRKELLINDECEDQKDHDIIGSNPNNNELSSSTKSFEETSSDMDGIEEKITKMITDETSSVASRRPVRNKTRPKNEDFEYDLSNILKMEAQGYRDSQSVANSKTSQSKKKPISEHISNSDSINKDCCGALSTLSKRALKYAAAHAKVTIFSTETTQKERNSSLFVRPMLPRSTSKGDKVSPKKDEDVKEKDIINPQSPHKLAKIPESVKLSKGLKSENAIEEKSTYLDTEETKPVSDKLDKSNEKKFNSDMNRNDTIDPIISSTNKPAVLPLKFRRQSLEVMKNPIINKNITDFSKAGMKTKILVIKPINRNKDGTQSISTPVKFQTIKLKDPSKSFTSSNDTSSDQVVVVKVPKVDCAISRSNNESTTIINKEKPSTIISKDVENGEDNVQMDNNTCSHEDDKIVKEDNVTNVNHYPCVEVALTSKVLSTDNKDTIEDIKESLE